MSEFKHKGPINIPIESDDDVFEIDGDAVDLDADLTSIGDESEAAASDAETSAQASDSDGSDASEEPAPAAAAASPEDGAEDAGAAGRDAAPAVGDFDPFVPPPSPQVGFDPYATPDAEAPVAVDAEPDPAPAKANEISREAVFEMMQELRQKSEQVVRLTEEKSELMDRLLRKQAEFENFRKRGEREMLEAYGRARADLVSEMLSVLDNFDLALRHADSASADVLREGIQLIHRQLMDTLGRLGLEPIDAEGQPFDPELHDAVATETSEEVPDHTVVGVLQRGFRLGDRMLRPARVRVAVQP